MNSPVRPGSDHRVVFKVGLSPRPGRVATAKVEERVDEAITMVLPVYRSESHGVRQNSDETQGTSLG